MAFRKVFIGIFLFAILVFLGVENASLNFQRTTGLQEKGGQDQFAREQFNQINRQLILPVANHLRKDQRQNWQQIKDTYNEKKKQMVELGQSQYQNHGKKIIQDIRCWSDKLIEKQI